MSARRHIANAVKRQVYRSGFGAQYANAWWMLRARSRSPWLDWNLEKNAVFIHVPKNAGTSLYKMLEIPVPRETHCTALGYRSSNREAWDRSFTFAFCRNPWDRFVSAFFYLKNKPISADDKSWAELMLSPYRTFEDFALAMEDEAVRADIFIWRHFAPQWYFLSDLSGQIIVDHVARFEQFEAEAMELGQRLGVDVVSRRENFVPREHYSAHYSDRLKSIVADAYQQDIELFDYTFETPQR